MISHDVRYIYIYIVQTPREDSEEEIWVVLFWPPDIQIITVGFQGAFGVFCPLPCVFLLAFGDRRTLLFEGVVLDADLVRFIAFPSSSSHES